MKIKLGIIIKNQVLLRRLTTSFINYYANEFEIFSFSDISSLLEVFKLDYFDLIIADEDFEVSKLPEDITLVYITDKRDLDFISDFPAIFMYQNIDKMYMKIKEIYISKKKVLEYRRNTKVHGFISAKGGVGTTSICLEFLRKKVEDGSKVFYLTLDPYESIDSEGIDLEEAILTMKIDRGKIKEFIEEKENLHFFSIIKSVNSRKNISSKDYINLIKFLKDESYELVIDLSNDITSEFIKEDIIDRLYIVSDGKENTIKKNKNLVSYIKEVDANFLNNVRIIFNKVDKEFIREDYGLKVTFEINNFYNNIKRNIKEELDGERKIIT